MNTKSFDTTKATIDLHIHTTASDGTFSPNQVVKIASQLKLKAIAITDHDTVKGIEEALEAAKSEDIEIISGIEFSTEINNESIHIVGLFVDHKNLELKKLTYEILNAREIRAQKIIEKVNELNIGPKITLEEVKEISNGVIGRPHIGEIMVKKGYAKSQNQVFTNFLRRNGPAYVPRFKLSPKEAIQFLCKIKAIPILAHPGYISPEIQIDEFIKDLATDGLAGIEVYYPTHTKENVKLFKELAKKYHLLESGGSDCHGLLNDGPFIGSLKIPYSILAKMKEKFGFK
ncbi:MAG: PHP domain-containing protein [Candidatus Heimdallarchaeota archaeon]|nr:PHP domain-containing protein [Candidatus Heimdallarchaeota archaeon]